MSLPMIFTCQPFPASALKTDITPSKNLNYLFEFMIPANAQRHSAFASLLTMPSKNRVMLFSLGVLSVSTCSLWSSKLSCTIHGRNVMIQQF